MSNLKYIFIDFISLINNDSYDKMLSEQDLYGRTPLHYAAMAGNIFLLTSNHWTIPHKPQHYNIKDKDNMTALDILFETMPSFKPKNGKMVLKLPYNCNSVDWFKFPGCSDIRSELLDIF